MLKSISTLSASVPRWLVMPNRERRIEPLTRIGHSKAGCAHCAGRSSRRTGWVMPRTVRRPVGSIEELFRLGPGLLARAGHVQVAHIHACRHLQAVAKVIAADLAVDAAELASD